MSLSPYNNTTTTRLPDEAELVRLAADGDQAAYGRLYTFYYPQLYTSLAFIAQSHEDAQEIIHEVFLKIWKAKESLILVRSFEDYTYTLAKNLLFNQLKRKKVGLRVIQTLSDQTTGQTAVIPEQAYLYKQYYEAAIQAIQKLPKQKQRIFLLRTQEGMSLEEIAVEMDISVSAVKKHLYAAFEMVKETLRKTTGDILLLLLLYIF